MSLVIHGVMGMDSVDYDDYREDDVKKIHCFQ